METKKIAIIAVIVIVIAAIICIFAAGLFNGNIDGGTFEFAPVEDYALSEAIDDGVALDSNSTLEGRITVKEIDKNKYDKLKSESPASQYSTITVNGKDIDEPYEAIKTVNESNLYIISEKMSEDKVPSTMISMNLSTTQVTTGLFEKDGSYYMVQIFHKLDENAIDGDIQIIKDIFNSLKKK